MVHQHFQLIPVFTVVENVVLGDELRTRPGPRPRHRAPTHRRARASGTGSSSIPTRRSRTCRSASSSASSCSKALFRDADILILDEPTAVLTPGEVDEFFGIVRSLVDQGKSIVFITHKLREVLAGRRPHHRAAPRTRRRYRRSRGRRRSRASPRSWSGATSSSRSRRARRSPGAPLLRVRDLDAWPTIAGVVTVSGLDFSVRAGRDLRHRGRRGQRPARARRGDRGHARPFRRDASRSTARTSRGATPREVQRARRRPRARGPQQARHRRPFTIADNLVLNTYYRQPFARRRIRQLREHRRAGRATRRSATTSARPGSTSRSSHLSGGNQQKVIIARELSGDVEGAARRAADAWPRRRFDRVHPSSASSRCATGHGGAARVGRARRDLHALRPHRRAVPRRAGRRVRPRRRPRAIAVGLLMASGRATCRSGAARMTEPRREPPPSSSDSRRLVRALLRPAAGARADLRDPARRSRSAAS